MASQETVPYSPDGSSPIYQSLLSMFWRRKWLILLGIAVSLAAVTLYHSRRETFHSSSAQVLVVKKRPETLAIGGTPLYDFEDYLSTHQALIRSPLIARRAVTKGKLESLPSFAGIADPTGIIIGSVSVTRDLKATNILNLSYQGRIAEDCRVVLEAVLASYKEFLDENYRNVSDDTVEQIKQARNILQKDLAQHETAYREYRLKTPLMWKGKDGINVHQERLARIESEKSGLQVKRTEAESRLASMERALAAGQSRAAILGVLTKVNGKSTSDASRSSPHEDALAALLLQEALLLEDYGPDHPQVRAVRKRIEFGRAQVARLGSNGEEAPFKDTLDLHLQALKLEIMELKEQERSLGELFEREQTEARKLTQHEVEGETLMNNVARTQQLYEGIIKRLQEVSIVKDMGGFNTSVVHPPSMGAKVSAPWFPLGVAALFFGTLLGVGLAYVAELTDKSFRSPDEIRRRLGLLVVGHVPYLKATRATSNGSTAKLDPMLAAYHQPKSLAAEAFRGVRTALYFSTGGQAHKVIQITSPNVGDGKTTLAANLAISVAQSGKKTLLIDADFRKSKQHKLFGVPNRIGLATVLASEAELTDAIQASAIPNLDVLPCGPHPSNPAELLTSPRFKELLDVIRERYDFIVLDTPPLLAVTDPCVVAPRVDGVFLALRITKNGRPDAERAKEVLDTLEATVLGVVVNARSVSDKYGYGYGGYRYGYDYSYGDRRRNESYYSETGEKEEPVLEAKE